MKMINKAVLGAIAGYGVYELTRNRGPKTVRLAAERNPPARLPSPPLSPARVRAMVLDWGMSPDRFEGEAREWAETAATLLSRGPLALMAPAEVEAYEQPSERSYELEDLLEDFFESESTPGHFYHVQPGDTPRTVAEAALATVGPASRQAVLEYIWCFSSGSYNLKRYGGRSTSNSYPNIWMVPGLGMGLRGAFLPRNADALDHLAQGEVVPRTIDDNAVSLVEDATSYATIWLPKVCPDALAAGEISCARYAWSDGSTALEPPPMLLWLLREAA